MGLGDETFERLVRAVLDLQIKNNRTAKQKENYVRNLKNQHKTRLDLINKILKDYESTN